MLICNLLDKKFNYEFEKLTRLFFPFERITVINERAEEEQKTVISEELTEGKTCLNVEFKTEEGSFSLSEEVYNPVSGDEKERLVSVLLYKILCKQSGKTPPWGILTGVRPARLYLSTKRRLGQSGANKYFREKLLVSESKIKLCEAVAEREEQIINSSKEKDASLYISIPFCPSRCSYCSFVSHSVEDAAKLIPQYLEYLLKEIEITANAAKHAGLTIKTIYMGGGTPTTLSAEQLKMIFDAVYKSFDTSLVSEFTVEAGRPDTITPEKLAVIKESGANRLSVNPQSMCDNVLQAIGRKHTAKQFKDAFCLARRFGFDNINCDLIAGLPTDNSEGFDYTLSEILKLSPESITVHALSMKRASFINKEEKGKENLNDLFAINAVNSAAETLLDNGYLPYYTYRQSKTVGNLENVGYSKPGYESFYNVYIMDETHTILAVGASAVTKLRSNKTGAIKRIFNYKYPYEYINSFEKLMEAKKEINLFFKNN